MKGLARIPQRSHGFFCSVALLLLFGSNARGAGEFLEAVQYRLIVGGSDRQLFLVVGEHGILKHISTRAAAEAQEI